MRPGHLVEVPFGRQRLQGVVLRVVAEPAVAETKAVLDLVDPQVALSAAQLALAVHLAEATLAPLSTCVNLMVPAGLNKMGDFRYEAAGPLPAPQGDRTPGQQRLLSLLQRRGALHGRQIDRALPRQNWRPAARELSRHGLVSIQPVLSPPSVHPKVVRTVQLARAPQVVAAELDRIGKKGSQSLLRRQAILHFLMREPGPLDVSWAYAESGGDLQDLYALAERGLVILGESEVWRDPVAGIEFVPSEPPPLTRDQEAAWEAILAGLAQAAAGLATPPYLLHGVTGSGKTEIYLRAVEEVLRNGGQAIVLVPEIALTPQTVRRFLARFPGQVGLLHSQLSTGERYDTWRRAQLGQLGVVVGPRSALFTPFPRLQLIVVDECHDDSYYQGEGPPYYHALQAAVAYARLAGAVCVLGSATPDLTSRHRAEQGQWRYLQLPERILAHHEAVRAHAERLSVRPEALAYRSLEGLADGRDLPPVRVVDMRQELKAGNRSIFSRALQEALQQVLEHEQQAILFLNRRGAATYIFCRDCGRSLRCPRCDTPLTYHSPPSTQETAPPAVQPSPPGLTCHHCGYRAHLPEKCPQCGSQRIRRFGTGTERVETELRGLYPGARTLRWDYETTRNKGAHDIILSHFQAGRADVLVGTQMLAKGLDLPLVTLVGVVLAEVGLNLPDYRAAERTFQVLTQVAGRAGRSPLGGEVILQTFQPEHYAIQAAAGHDYQAFYERELAYRRELGYPPFTQLVRLEYRHMEDVKAEQAARQLAGDLRARIASEDRRATEMIGPAPCFYARLNRLYRWQIILRGPDPASLLRGRPPGEWRIEVNPPNLL